MIQRTVATILVVSGVVATMYFGWKRHVKVEARTELIQEIQAKAEKKVVKSNAAKKSVSDRVAQRPDRLREADPYSRD